MWRKKTKFISNIILMDLSPFVMTSVGQRLNPNGYFSSPRQSAPTINWAKISKHQSFITYTFQMLFKCKERVSTVNINLLILFLFPFFPSCCFSKEKKKLKATARIKFLGQNNINMVLEMKRTRGGAADSSYFIGIKKVSNVSKVRLYKWYEKLLLLANSAVLL